MAGCSRIGQNKEVLKVVVKSNQKEFYCS